MSAKTAIRFDDVTLGYGRRPAVHHLAGEIAAGSLTAVVGPNGAGKSTLLKGIVGTLRPLAGRIELTGGPQARIAYLPQAADLDRTFPLAVYDLVAMGLWSRSGLFGGIGRKDRARIEEALAAVGLIGFERRPISTLSGGQMQRALFARLLLQDASVILLDEPFTAIDAKTTADLLDLVRRWHDESRTVVTVLHDLDVVKRVFPSTLLIAREPIAWGDTGEVLSAANLLKARRMVEAHDPHARACERTVA
jgi:zinc/manganese transport system ATP-binding protein